MHTNKTTASVTMTDTRNTVMMIPAIMPPFRPPPLLRGSVTGGGGVSSRSFPGLVFGCEASGMEPPVGGGVGTTVTLEGQLVVANKGNNNNYRF